MGNTPIPRAGFTPTTKNLTALVNTQPLHTSRDSPLSAPRQKEDMSYTVIHTDYFCPVMSPTCRKPFGDNHKTGMASQTGYNYYDFF